jgi:glucose-6-phosphate 1-dehydrogenase
MSSETQVQEIRGESPRPAGQAVEPCLLVLFGASGDLTKRLLTPACDNHYAEGLLPERFRAVSRSTDG